MRKLTALLSLLLCVFAGCGEGEFTLELVNRGDKPLTVTGVRNLTNVPADGRGHGYVKKIEGNEVVIKAGDQVLDTLVLGKSFPMPGSKESVFYYVGDRTNLALTDPSEFYVIDSTLDKAMATKDPKVKLVAKMEDSPFIVVTRQMMLSENGAVTKSVPTGSHYYRLVKLPPDLPDDKVDEYLQQEFKTAAAAK